MSWGARLEKGGEPAGGAGAVNAEAYPRPADLPATLAKVAAAIIVLVLVSVYWALARPSAGHQPTVAVLDGVQRLDTAALLDDVAELRYWQPVEVAFVTIPGTGDAETGLKAFASGALGALGETRTKPASDAADQDGPMLAIGVVPEGVMRPGEGVMVVADQRLKVSPKDLDSIAEAITDSTGAQPGPDTDWNRALLAGADAAIPAFGRPWYAGWASVLPIAVTLGALGYLALVAARVSGTKKTLRNARAQYQEVAAGAALTKQRADALDATDPHADDLRRRFVRWSRTLDETGARLDSLSTAGPLTRMTKSFATAADHSIGDMQLLHGMDIALEAASELFARTGNWQEYWANEEGPVYEDLAGLHWMLDEPPDDAIPTRTRDKARRHVEDSRERLRALAGDIEILRVTPGNALAELDRITDATQSNARAVLRSLLAVGRDKKAEARIAEYEATDWSDIEPYEGAWSFGKDDGEADARGTYLPDCTIRSNPMVLGADPVDSEDAATVHQLHEAWSYAEGQAN